MSRIEAEARELLTLRRNTLRRREIPAPSDPARSWTDYEAAPPPPTDGVRRELAEIDAALLRIAEGKYGTCQHCGGPMGLQRLRALPEARFCLSCSGTVPLE